MCPAEDRRKVKEVERGFSRARAWILAWGLPGLAYTVLVSLLARVVCMHTTTLEYVVVCIYTYRVCIHQSTTSLRLNSVSILLATLASSSMHMQSYYLVVRCMYSI